MCSFKEIIKYILHCESEYGFLCHLNVVFSLLYFVLVLHVVYFMQVEHGFQKFGFPSVNSSELQSRSHMTSVLQGLQFGMRCLAQLTATQYAYSMSHQADNQSNHGRIMIFCCLKR